MSDDKTLTKKDIDKYLYALSKELKNRIWKKIKI